jgi:hypothetical protein
MAVHRLRLLPSIRKLVSAALATREERGRATVVKLSGDLRHVFENRVKVGNEVLAFAFVIRAITGEGIQERRIPEAGKQHSG